MKLQAEPHKVELQTTGLKTIGWKKPNSYFPELGNILFLFISTRIILAIIGVSSRVFLGFGSGRKYGLSQFPWLDIWGVWDSFWYLDIANKGYSAQVNHYGKGNYAFFPLYPILMKIVGEVLNNKYFLAGLLISNICLLAACLLLYWLVRNQESERTAQNSIKYLFLFPVSFIYSGIFTESLYLALAIGCFYLASQRKWFFVGIAGYLLALTRSLGVFIIIPMLYEYLKTTQFNWRNIKPNILFLLFIPLGLLTFCLYLYYLTGDFFAFKTIQSAWGREAGNPLMILIMSLFKDPSTRSGLRSLIEAGFTLGSIVVLAIFYKKLRLSYGLFCLYSILIPLSTGILSMPRLILPIFPIYILLAKLSRNKTFDQMATLILGLLQGFFMVFWSTGRPLII